MNAFKNFKPSNPLLTLFTACLLATTTLSTAYALQGTASSTTNQGSTTSAAKISANDQKRIQNIISRVTKEINRRLSTLNELSAKVYATTKLTGSEKSQLTTKINNEISGLNSLKASLASATSVAAAQADGQSLINDYRVYVLVVPQVNLIKTADDQQVAESRLAQLATILVSKLSSSTNTTQKNDLANLNRELAAAQSLSSTVETNVLALTPDNYTGNHSLLVKYYGNLKSAQANNQSAYASARAIVNNLTSAKRPK